MTNKPKTVKLYNAFGGSMEVEDTLRRRAWAKGKGYEFDKNPKSAAPEPKPPATSDD